MKHMWTTIKDRIFTLSGITFWINPELHLVGDPVHLNWCLTPAEVKILHLAGPENQREACDLLCEMRNG